MPSPLTSLSQCNQLIIPGALPGHEKVITLSATRENSTLFLQGDFDNPIQGSFHLELIFNKTNETEESYSLACRSIQTYKEDQPTKRGITCDQIGDLAEFNLTLLGTASKQVWTLKQV